MKYVKFRNCAHLYQQEEAIETKVVLEIDFVVIPFDDERINTKLNKEF